MDQKITRSWSINGKGPVHDKYVANMVNGIRRFAPPETKPPNAYAADEHFSHLIHRGNPPKHHDGIALRGFFDEAGVQELYERVTVPMEHIARFAGAAIYTPKHWTPHITVSHLRCIPDPRSILDRAQLFAHFAHAYTSKWAIESTIGTVCNFDTLFIGGAITLAATHIPLNILEVRDGLTRLAGAHGMDEMSNKNILHVTATRLQAIGPHFDPVAFVDGVLKLHKDIQHRPVELVVKGASIFPNRLFERHHESTVQGLSLNKGLPPLT